VLGAIEIEQIDFDPFVETRMQSFYPAVALAINQWAVFQ
jgi:hypothetical protein